ncbi:MAG: hypothetical protein RR952_06635 [Cetobacterium sp.]
MRLCMEKVACAIEEYGSRMVQEYVADIKELNEMISDQHSLLDFLEDNCEELTKELYQAKDEIAELCRGLKTQQELIERLEAKLKLLPMAIELGISESELELALDMAQRSINRETGETKVDSQEKPQPSCCAAGYCGTSRCGGSCRGAEVAENDTEEEFDLDAIIPRIAEGLGIRVVRVK